MSGTTFAQVRDHRGGGASPVVEGPPREAPPPPREERMAARAGFIYQPGRWDWKHGKWEWIPGHYERERAGKRWREAKWENRNGSWVLVDGDWIDAGPMGPTMAPPALREERMMARPGFVFVRGRWDWRGNKWEWVAGHYERERAGKRWREAVWENRNGTYVLVDGDWIDGPAGPTLAPPPMREEKWEARHGFIYIRGRWDWRGNKWEWIPGHYERERHGKHWREAKWENRNGSWVLVDGDWDEGEVMVGPSAAPPSLREEKWEARQGFIWVRGRWDWKNGNWDWVPGHYERERAGKRWRDANWENRNGSWVLVDGGWMDGAMVVGPVAAPPPPKNETLPPRPGMIVYPGWWAWENNQYMWHGPGYTPVKAGYHWSPARWEIKDGHWSLTVGDYAPDTNAPPPPPPPPPPVGGPRSAPPPLREESAAARAGFIWVRGHWGWSANNYEWIAGHYERERANSHWYDGKWEQRGDTWVWVDGAWR
jgi:hypothetical protein